MDIQPMPRKILPVTNPMIRESLLPKFSLADFLADRVRIPTLNELHRSLKRYVRSRREEEMNVIGH